MGDLDDTKDAYILRQKIAACFGAFVTRVGGAGNPENVESQSPSGEYTETMEPGIIQYLGEGEKVEFAIPPVVGDLESFFRIGARDIAMGLGVTLEALTGDLSNVNFSSGRLGWLEFQRNITSWTEHMLSPQMCEKIGRWILDGLRLMASVAPVVEIGWTPPRREMIDPGEEYKAAAQAAKDGLGTRSSFLRSVGLDPEQVDKDRAEELVRERELGLSYDTNVSTEAKDNAAAAKAAAAQPLTPAPAAKQDPAAPVPTEEGDANALADH
jgi:capsid protein